MPPLYVDISGSPPPAIIALDIPIHLRNIILPPKSLSVISLNRYSALPGPCSLLEPELYHKEAWLSTHLPGQYFEPQQLRDVALPPIGVIRALKEELTEDSELATRTKSITLVHLPEGSQLSKQVPLWVVTYWEEAYRARALRQAWKVGLEWAQRATAGSLQGREMLQVLRNNLAYLPWDEKLQGDIATLTALSSVSDYFPQYLSHSCLKGTHIDQLLARLRGQLDSAPETSFSMPPIIVGPDLLQDIVSASQDTPENISESGLPKYKALRSLEFDLVHGFCATVGGVAWINSNHYVFVVLNVRDRYLGYGDSMHGEIPSSLRQALLWWIGRLIEQGLPQNKHLPVDQWLRRLPVTTQASSDGFSCGLLAVNGLTHHLLPHITIPKIESFYYDSLERIVPVRPGQFWGSRL